MSRVNTVIGTIAAILIFATVALQQPVKAIPPGPGTAVGASGFAPGHEVSSIGSGLPGDAKNFAPGHQVPPGPAQRQHDGASDFTPGQEFTPP